ncbi:helix-turn-helix domain-containing protein [Yoonia sp. GPGPB17]|uniref:helix-turn-helix domain-containing protein n=1 Tax=Yoonia sp. GPGPB17 TaxID=3026147 RepID=UPI0030BD2BA5
MGQTIINIEQLRQQSEGHPCLPSNWERENLIRLIDEVAPLIGLKAKAVATFRAMISRTKPSAFKDPNAEPICYVHQTEIAHSLRVSAKTVRNHEHALEKLGLIERRTMANGARTGFQGCGIYFSAAIRAIPEMLARVQAAEADRREHAKLRGLRSTHYKHTKGVLNELITQYGRNAELNNLLCKFDDWPHSSALHRMTLDDLYDHVDEAAALCAKVIELELKYQEYAARPEEKGASYIQDSNQDSSNKSCNASEAIWTEDKSSDANLRVLRLTAPHHA